MNLPPPLPKPIVTYTLCDCDEPACVRMPIRQAQDVAEEFRLRGMRVLGAAS